MNERDKSTMNRHITLEHRHFCFIAGVLRDAKPMNRTDVGMNQWQATVNAFIAECKRSNSRFNADRFAQACNHER